MKICVNCKHRCGILDTHLCYHPNNGMDLVTGRITSVRCADARRSDEKGACGPDGLLFEEASKRPPAAPAASTPEAPTTPEALTRWQRVKALLREVWAW